MLVRTTFHRVQVSARHSFVPEKKGLFIKCLAFFLSLAWALGAVLVASQSAHAELTAEQNANVINLSGKQRMLTQKMSKEALLVALGVHSADNANRLEGTVSLFDRTLKGLKNGDSELGLPATESKRITRQLDKVGALWQELKPVVDDIAAQKSASPEQIKRLAGANLPLLKAMNKAVLMYEKAAGKGAMSGDTSRAAAINLAGKQRMLTQKMSKEALLIAYQHDVEDNQLNLTDTYSLFERTLEGLASGDDTLGLSGTQSTSILKQLASVKSLWADFRPLMERVANGGTADLAVLEKIESKNLPLLKEMNKAVKLFETE